MTFCQRKEMRVFKFYMLNFLKLDLIQIIVTCSLSFTAFRFTSVFPPEPHLLANEKIESLRLNKLVPSCIQPLEIMIQVWFYAPVLLNELTYAQELYKHFFCSLQLEGSGNWPMDETAIEKIKSSFLIQIGERWRLVYFICFSIMFFFFSV